jgi:lipid-A-disaccharide synthase
MYYVPPGSWKRQGKASPELAKAADLIVTPFDWSVERYSRAGGNVKFLGHPLLDIVRPSMTRAEFANKFGLEPGKPIVGLLPGSRRYEIEYNTPAMVEAAKRIRAEIPDAQFVFGISSSTPRESVERWLSRAPSDQEQGDGHANASMVAAVTRKIAGLGEKLSKRPEPKFVTPEGVQVPASVVRRQEAREHARHAREGADPPPTVIASGITYDVQAHSDVLLCCSGTATLEAAILGTPMVILYRFPRWMEVEGRLRRLDKRIVHMGLPNIIADARVVPELMQYEANPEALAAHALRFLLDPVARAEAKAALARVRDRLGSPGASRRAAELAVELAGVARAT